MYPRIPSYWRLGVGMLCSYSNQQTCSCADVINRASPASSYSSEYKIAGDDNVNPEQPRHHDREEYQS